jgi:hypothetical protein
MGGEHAGGHKSGGLVAAAAQYQHGLTPARQLVGDG